MKDKARSAKTASFYTATLDSTVKDHAIDAISKALIARKDEIFKANLLDLETSKKENVDQSLHKRLNFDEQKLKDTIEGLNSLIRLPDPVGNTLMTTELDQDLELYKISCPIGVIGIVFESRPDALVQIAALCLKSGNAVMLKGGSEAKHTNKILEEIIETASLESGLPKGWIQLLETREDVSEMLKLDEYIDLIIPRGSNEFVKYIIQNSTIPVLGHADGICHCYVDKDADLEQAVTLVNDSKTQYTSVCNAAETLLVHKEIAVKFLPKIKLILDQSNVKIFGCSKTMKIIQCEVATVESYKTEYLDYSISIKVVDTIDDGINHIHTYGSGHTDAIYTENKETASHFMNLVDTANVFWNCSTRFSDGFRYGFGAEVGISTNKIHARGPVGLEGLLIYKYKMIGKGHIVKDYAEGLKSFKHNKINKPFHII